MLAAELATIDFALFAGRLILGLTLAAHGYQKFFKGGKIAGTAGWFDSIGMKPGKVNAVMAASTEVGAGLLLAVGLLTTFAAAGFCGLMLVAGYTSHRGNFFIVRNGWEYNFVLAAMASMIAMIGPGQLSLDNVLGLDTQLDGWLGFAISAGAGSMAGIVLLAAVYRPEHTAGSDHS